MAGNETYRKGRELRRPLIGDAFRAAGDLPRARAAYEQVLAIARTMHLSPAVGPHHVAASLFAQAAVGFAHSWNDSWMPEDRRAAYLEEALDLLGEEDTPDRAVVLGMLSRVLLIAGAHGRGRAAALGAQAVAIARRTGDRATCIQVLHDYQLVLRGPALIDERAAIVDELTGLAEASGNLEWLRIAHDARMSVALIRGDMRTAIATMDAFTHVAGLLDQPLFIWRAAARHAMRALLAGRFTEGEQLATQAFAYGNRVPIPNAAHAFTTQMLWLRREQGRLGELQGEAERLVQRYPTIPAWRAVLAMLYVELDRREEARREFEQLAAIGFDRFPDDVSWLDAMMCLSDVCAYLDDAPRAAVLYRLLLPYAALNAVADAEICCLGSVSRALGLLATVLLRRLPRGQLRLALADGPERDALLDWPGTFGFFEDALAMHERLGSPPLVARTAIQYAEALQARRLPVDLERARTVLIQAAAAYRDMGLVDKAGDVERRVVDIQRLLPRPDGLTRREVEILRLLADGNSNRDIAARLVLSVHTVERHVATIYSKTGVTNRADAAIYWINNG